MKYIELSQGEQVIVDDEDYAYHSQWKWYCHRGYAVRNAPSRRVDGRRQRSLIRMHRYIMSTPPGFETDHINGNKLDNRRSNLRIVTKSQNQWNRRKQAGSSQYKGVYWNKKNERWHVQLQVDKRKVWLGYYKTEEEARDAYADGVKRFYGEFARLP